MRINQPHWRPTNKLTAGAVGAALTAIARAFTVHFYPFLDSPEMWCAVAPVVVLSLGYLIRDEDNTPEPPVTPQPAPATGGAA